MADSKKDPAAEARKAATEAAQATERAQRASMDALEHSATTLAETSSDAAFSTGEENPDPNPLGLRPAPGPSYIEYPGKAKEES